MEMEFLLLVSGIAGIIQLIVIIVLISKFFQLTSDVRDIRNKCFSIECTTPLINGANNNFIPQSSLENKDINQNKFQIGELVVRIEDDKQMRVKEYNGNKYSCYTNNGAVYEGDYDDTEIERFQYKK